jgi:hypothetical protein
MRDPQFRQQQEDDLRAAHVAPVNALVDELTDPPGRGRVPYVAPSYGDTAGLPVSETISWNAYPWYINRSPRAPNWRPESSRCAGSSASFRRCGLSCSTAGQPRTAGGDWPDGIPT